MYSDLNKIKKATKTMGEWVVDQIPKILLIFPRIKC